MTELLLLLLVSLIPKIALCITMYSIVRQYYENRLFSLAFAYLLSYLSMILFMLVLSPFHLLSRWGLVACYGLTIVILTIWKKRCFPVLTGKQRISNKAGDIIRSFTAADWAALLIVAATFVLLALRSLYYYDNTDDAMIQGLPKIGFIIQHRSLFVYYETVIINTFSNEWLGELNSVYYMAMTQKDLSTSFANVEIWFVMVAFFGSAFNIFRSGRKPNWVFTSTVSCSAVVTGIAMTIKTDLFAMALLPFAVACLYQYYREETPQNLFAAIVALGAAAGAKIAILPAAGLAFLMLVFYYFFRAKKKTALPVLLGGVFFAAACLRYILNIWYYHNPFQRAINEKVSISFDNLVMTIRGLVNAFNESPEIWGTREPWSTSNWAVNKGLGWAGYPFAAILIVAAIWFLIKLAKKEVRPRRTTVSYITLPVLCGMIFTMLSTKWYDWSFRYYAPYIFTAVIPAAAWLSAQWKEVYISSRMIRTLQALGQMGLLLSCLFNMEYSFRYGQAIPVTYENTQVMTQTERKLVFSSFVKADDFVAIPRLMEILETGGRALITLEFSYPVYYQYFGNDECVDVTLVYDADQILSKGIAGNGEYDFIVLTYDPNRGFEAEDELLTETFEKMGYEKYVLSSSLIYVK